MYICVCVEGESKLISVFVETSFLPSDVLEGFCPLQGHLPSTDGPRSGMDTSGGIGLIYWLSNCLLNNKILFPNKNVHRTLMLYTADKKWGPINCFSAF